MRIANRVKVVSIIAACGLACGCAGPGRWDVGAEQHRPPMQSMAGSVHVSVLSVMPFEKFKEQLQPRFELKESEALAKVIPPTVQIDERLLSALNAQVGVSLPSSSVTETREFKDPSDPDKLTGYERKETKTPGAAPTAAASSAGIAAAREGKLAPPQPGTALPSNFTPQLEPALQYLAATALKQEVVLLSNYVANAPIDEGYTAYVVRLQVSLMPRSRGIPYDATTTLSFLPSIGAGADARDEGGQQNPAAQFIPLSEVEQRTKADADQTKPGSDPVVRVIPLLVTDNLEAARRSMTREDVLRLALALTAQIKGVGAKVDVERVLDRLESVLSTELNSIMTIGRAGDNSLVVRFGAARIGTAKYEMVARTHNVTALVLVPKPVKGPFPLSIASRTIMSDATNPMRPVVGRLWPDRLDEARQRLRAYDVRVEHDRRYVEARGTLSESAFASVMRAVQENDPRAYSAALRLDKDTAVLAPAEAQLLWADLVSVRQGSQFSLTSVRMPRWSPATIAGVPRQTITALDDGETVSAVVDGVEGVDAGRVSAALVVNGQRLMARSASRSGRAMELVFDSPQLWKMTSGSSPWSASIDLAYQVKTGSEETKAESSATFPGRVTLLPADGQGGLMVSIREIRDPSKPELVLSSPSNQIFAKAVSGQADLSGSATIELVLAEPARSVGLVRVRVRGGVPGSIAGAATDGLDYLVSVNGRAKLNIPLTGLSKATPVQIAASPAGVEPDLAKGLTLTVVGPPK